MSDFTSLWLQDEDGVYLYTYYNNSEAISRREQALGLAFDAPPFFGHARATKTQLPFSPKSSFEGPLTVRGEPQPMARAEQETHLLASRGDLFRDQLRPRVTGPFFPFPSHPLAVLFQDNHSTSRALKEALLKE